MSTYNEVRESLWATIRSGAELDGMYMQKRPYTIVTLSMYGYEGVGFAKAHYKDEWNPEYGVWMALQKAVASLAKILAGKKEYVKHNQTLHEVETNSGTFFEGVDSKFLDVEL